MIDQCKDADWDLFAMGALDAGVQRQMEEHLRSGCTDCRRSYKAALETMTALACAVPQVRPSAGIAEALRLRIGEPAGAATGLRPVALAPRIEPRPMMQPKTSQAWGAFLPWSIAAVLALVALWLGLSLQHASQELERSKANSQVLPGPVPASGVAKSSGEQPSDSASLSGLPGTSAASGVGAAGPDTKGSVAAKDADASRLRTLTERLAELQTERDSAVAQWDEARSSLAQAVAARDTLQAQIAAAQEHAGTPPSSSGEAHDAHQDVAEQTELAELSGQLRQANATIAGLRSAVARDGRILAFFRAGPSRQIDLKSIDAGAGGATGVAYYAPDRGLLVLVRNLPQLPGGECYQIWSVHKSGTAIMSVGLISTDGAGGGYLFAGPSSDLRQLSALAITDEPKGGSLSARGRKLLFGALD